MIGVYAGSQPAQNLDPRCSTQPSKSALVILFGQFNTWCSGARMFTGDASSVTSSARWLCRAGYGANVSGTNSCVL